MVLILGLFLFLATGFQLQGQTTPPQVVAGELLVQMEAELKTWPRSFLEQGIRPSKALIPSMSIWLVEVPQGHETALLAWLRQQKQVRLAQYNHYISLRSPPNDPLFSLQWPLHNTGQTGGSAGADIQALQAWNLSTGGLTPFGDTIVICVIDDGLDTQHPDFQRNRWYNYAEIPNNGIDDDQNGYVDDYLGWNTYRQNDDLSDANRGGAHGTPVTSIIAADGNNNLGVTGLNWQVKIMTVVGGGTEAQNLAAYAYPLLMRKRYNESNGQAGAFVVATNASWGLDNLFPADAPLWCAIYDSLGAQGILNIASTTNGNRNVDLTGDLPTTCPSPFLISVTNSNHNDQKEAAAGFGPQSIDLAAPGTGTHTLQRGGGYGNFGGTSAAAPHVTGLIGLLYAAACPRFTRLAKIDPAAAALEARQLVLDGTSRLPQFANLVATGGRLNAFRSLQLLLQQPCALNDCYPPLALRASAQNPQTWQISWAGSPATALYHYRYQILGDSLWQMGQTTDTNLILHNLQACTDYWFQVRSDCDTTQSAYSHLFTFRTGNCCLAPSLQSSQINEQTSIWRLNTESNVQQVLWQWRPLGDTLWQSNLGSDTLELLNLNPCTQYEWRAQSLCSLNTNNPWTRPQTWRTLGCGACLDQSFCNAKGLNSSVEWIESLSIIGPRTNWQHHSGQDQGYALHENADTLNLWAGETYELDFQVGFTSSPFVQWVIWIDFDRNGLFDDDTELVFQGSSAQSLQDSFQLPNNTWQDGSTRMRIAMRYGVLPPQACQNFNFGEVEDYCVYLNGGTATHNPDNQSLAPPRLYPNPSRGWLRFEGGQGRLELYDVLGRWVWASETEQGDLILPRYLSSGLYVWFWQGYQGLLHLRWD